MARLQLTLAIIKPHIVKNPVAVSFIRRTIKNNFIIVKSRRTFLTKDVASDFYKEHFGKFFYNRLVGFMSSGCVDIHIMAHVNAIDQWRRLMGPTKVFRAQFEDPHSLRGMFGLSDTRNVAHGSDSQTSAEREIQFFFPEFCLDKWQGKEEPLLRRGPLTFDEKSFQHAEKRQEGSNF